MELCAVAQGWWHAQTIRDLKCLFTPAFLQKTKSDAAHGEIGMNNFFTPLTISMLSISAVVYIGAWVLRKELQQESKKNEELKKAQELGHPTTSGKPS